MLSKAYYYYYYYSQSIDSPNFSKFICESKNFDFSFLLKVQKLTLTMLGSLTGLILLDKHKLPFKMLIKIEESTIKKKYKKYVFDDVIIINFYLEIY